ncbi:hypothetical protein RTM1035_05730 [Roseovarius sp. TM1035]|uniref:hypothetical protein n=1 Tax=unclassified Roseovarius TaxID=2614913 RepID=UPI00015571E7|nr:MULTISPECIES: hypothetical protein [unclassified Roseovarius]AWZ21210.1 Hypothetical protein RAK1035_2502 [Roseovarius sp. AK1035]EDM33093.1 hypothetical protein RTM1035_05730 [Roseovarius sp. TM1035]
MLSPEIPLKLSAAGIRLTGFMVENQLRVAQVYCEAFLKTGIWSRSLTAKAAVPATPVKTKAAPKPKVADANAKPRRAARAAVAPVAPATPAKAAAPVTPPVQQVAAPAAPAVAAKPAPLTEVKPAVQPVPMAAPKPAPVAEAALAPKPVAPATSAAPTAAQTTSQPTARVIPVDAGAPKRQPSPPPAMPQGTPKAKAK